MTEQYTPDDAVGRTVAPTDEMALLACDQLQALLHAARLVEAEAEEQQWTRIDPVELPGLLRAAGLLRTAAALHVENEHRHGVAPHS